MLTIALVTLATEVMKLINKIYDDTPEEQREENLARWYVVLDRLVNLFGQIKGGEEA